MLELERTFFKNKENRILLLKLFPKAFLFTLSAYLLLGFMGFHDLAILNNDSEAWFVFIGLIIFFPVMLTITLAVRHKKKPETKNEIWYR